MPELDGADENYKSNYSYSTASAIAAKMDLDLTLSEDDMLVSLGLNASGGELQIQLFANEADALGRGTGDSLLYEGSHLFNAAGFQMIDLGEGVDVSAAEELWVVYDNADGNAIMYEFTEGALTNDYCYFLNGDTWEGASASNALAPVSFYMVPEPGTLALVLYMGGGLFLLRRLRA